MSYFFVTPDISFSRDDDDGLSHKPHRVKHFLADSGRFCVPWRQNAKHFVRIALLEAGVASAGYF